MSFELCIVSDYWYHHFNVLSINFNVVFPNSSNMLWSMTRRPPRVGMTKTIFLIILSPYLPSSLCWHWSWWWERMLVPEQKSRQQSHPAAWHPTHREVPGLFFYMPVSCLRMPWWSTRVNLFYVDVLCDTNACRLHPSMMDVVSSPRNTIFICKN